MSINTLLTSHGARTASTHTPTVLEYDVRRTFRPQNELKCDNNNNGKAVSLNNTHARPTRGGKENRNATHLGHLNAGSALAACLLTDAFKHTHNWPIYNTRARTRAHRSPHYHGIALHARCKQPLSSMSDRMNQSSHGQFHSLPPASAPHPSIHPSIHPHTSEHACT